MALLIVVLCLLLLVMADECSTRKLEKSFVEFLSWVNRHPVQGVFATILVYTLATILFVPGSILNLGTGYAIGSAFGNKQVGVFIAILVRR